MDIKDFEKARDEMLIKCDLNEFIKFIKEHTEVFDEFYVNWFLSMDENFQLSVMHKFIVKSVNLPQELREKSEKWLEENKMKQTNVQNYYIFENGKAIKVTKEKYEEHEKFNQEHKIGELVLAEGEDDGQAD